MTVIQNVILVAVAVFAGTLVGVIVKERGPKAAAILFGAGTLIYLLSPRVSCRPDPDDPMIYITRKNFIREEEVACRWRVYDSDGQMHFSGWCTKDKNGEWYRFVLPEEDL